MINTQVIDPQELEMIHSKSSAIKCLALIDIVFSCFYIFASPFFALSAFIFFLSWMVLVFLYYIGVAKKISFFAYL